MSSVFDQPFVLSQKITEHLGKAGYEKLAYPNATRTFVYRKTTYLDLLLSVSVQLPGDIGLVIYDTPRASARVEANLYAEADDGAVHQVSVSRDDPRYRYLLAANTLAVARLVKNALSSDGVFLVVVNPDIYLVVRSAIEHYFGSDKFIGELVYQARSGGGSDSTHLSVDHETLLIFARDPESLTRWQIEKNDDEIAKYTGEDEIGSYRWDTYIRRQARNYYKIKAPDGKVLEKDATGNRISWLYSEDTFKKKLADGDVKFEKKDGNWRLYYKDRIKELKILRSLSLHATLLQEISPDASSSATGADLLNSAGSKEIKNFKGNKPHYLKPSTFYQFIFDVFGKSVKIALVPAREYGSALTGLVNSKSRATVLATLEEDDRALIEWRGKDAPGVTVNFQPSDKFRLEDFFINNEVSDGVILVEQIISLRNALSTAWHQSDDDPISFRYTVQNDVGYVVVRNIAPQELHQLPQLIFDAINGDKFIRLEIYTSMQLETGQFDRISAGQVTYAFHRFPDCFIP